jgi:regulator of ribonuclease activity A
MIWTTADLCDEHADAARVLPPVFRSYGARARFRGTVVTVRCFEDNALMKTTLATPGSGKVLAVDGGGSLRCALFGDGMAAIAAEAGWEGVVLYGCVRDTVGVARFDLGVRALGSHPRPPRRRGEGELGVPIQLAGVSCAPGDLLFADEDGIVILEAARFPSGGVP